MASTTDAAVRDAPSTPLSGVQFRKISRILYELSGIQLGPGKQELIKSRLSRRLRALGLEDFDDYIRHFEDDRTGTEVTMLVDSLATNKTSFFREMPHFDFLRHVVIPGWQKTSCPIRIWSAGCSSGEEPYSLAILLTDMIPEANRRVRILGTDISSKILAAARDATYAEDTIRAVPPADARRYFTCIQPYPPRRYRIGDSAREMVRFARLNLMDDWPVKGPFDLILCRNVMIYFDRETRERLVRRFGALLTRGGHFFVGHAESLAGLSTPLRYVQPAVYTN